jgi:metal-sulfur cluster biosynthetic enzyme/Fe-S cluster assembly iron-binding protein IscA
MTEAKRRPDAAPPEVDISATPEAVAALRTAWLHQPAGSGLRLWVETGIRPQVKMMFDRPNDRDLRGEVEGVPVWVDALSGRFLRGARIEHVVSAGQEGFHVVGPNVPGGGPGEPAPAEPAPPKGAPRRSAEGVDRPSVEAKIRAALKQIYDPEIPMNLIDLGLIYGIDWGPDDRVTVRMSLTSVGCPATEAIRDEVERAAREASGLAQVNVEVVWDPAWTPERMSLFAKRQFGYV